MDGASSDEKATGRLVLDWVMSSIFTTSVTAVAIEVAAPPRAEKYDGLASRRVVPNSSLLRSRLPETDCTALHRSDARTPADGRLHLPAIVAGTVAATAIHPRESRAHLPASTG
jgi:hypothetical protein